MRPNRRLRHSLPPIAENLFEGSVEVGVVALRQPRRHNILLLTSIETSVLTLMRAVRIGFNLTRRRYYPAVVFYSTRRSAGRMFLHDPQSQESVDEDMEVETISDGLADLSDISDMSVSNFAEIHRQSAKTCPNMFIATMDIPTPEPTIRKMPLCAAHRMAPAHKVFERAAKRMINYARHYRNLHEKDMCCLNCGLLPTAPVTGRCGHTRCLRCILEDNMGCPCGAENSPRSLHINILIQDLVNKAKTRPSSSTAPVPTSAIARSSGADRVTGNLSILSSSGSKRRVLRAPVGRHKSGQRIPMSPRARYNYALHLVREGSHLEAAAHFALAAASDKYDLRKAETLLAQSLRIVCGNRRPQLFMRKLKRMVRRVSSPSWLKAADMECILCCELLTNPVTTPCGHVFCRTCLERTLDYSKRCPLCLRPLDNFILSETHNTIFIKGALKSINAYVETPPPEPNLIPIFVCTVAYPTIPCPLFIFDPRHWLMIRRVLESPTRTFGMVACDSGQNYTDYGTILEVRDCVHLEDGRSIISTVGLSRFKVIERDVRDGCEVARILPIVDLMPDTEFRVLVIRTLATDIMYKATIWIQHLNSKIKAQIEDAFGISPLRANPDEEWWKNADGPSWLWWLIAVLPLRLEIKVLILSTDCLVKRMRAVDRTLESLNRAALTSPSGPSPQ